MTTSITKRETREELIARAPGEVQAGLEARKIRNAVAAEIAKLSWGQNMSQTTARAVADWGIQHQVDVLTEVDVLGGKLYLNARFYIRKLADLIAAGRVEYAEADHVNEDARLDSWPEERERRTRERIKHQIPDEAAGACVFRVKLVGMEREIVGVEWCGGPLVPKTQRGGSSDPIGEAEPAKTSETRAARRAIRLIASHVPTLKREVAEIEYAAAEIEPAIDEDIQSIEPPRKMIPVPQPHDPYAPETEQGDAFEGNDAEG